MSGKSRPASTEVTLSGDQLAGFSGRLDIITSRKQSWWRRLLRLPLCVTRQTVYGNVSGDKARVWTRR